MSAGSDAHTLMEVLSPLCPAVSVEAGLPAVEANHAYAASALRRPPGQPIASRSTVVIGPETGAVRCADGSVRSAARSLLDQV